MSILVAARALSMQFVMLVMVSAPFNSNAVAFAIRRGT